MQQLIVFNIFKFQFIRLLHQNSLPVSCFTQQLFTPPQQAQTPELKDRAYQIVSSVPGISRVYNEIAIAGATSHLQHTNDVWLTSKVKTALIAHAGLKSNEFKVVTENNVVYCAGVATLRKSIRK